MKHFNISKASLVSLLFIFGLSNLQAQNVIDFDGSNDYISVPNGSSYISGQNMSMSFWVYPRNPSPGYPNFDGIAGFRNDTNADFYLLQLSTSNVEARFRNSTGSKFDILYTGIVLNTWNHFALTYNGTTLTLYHNGVSVGTQAANGSITSTTVPFNIGYVPFSTPNFHLDGMMNDVCLWSKSLGANDVAALYSSCAVDLTAPGLQLCYEFNQGVAGGNNAAVTAAIDSKGNANGVLNNFTLSGTGSNFVASSPTPSSFLSAGVCGGTYTSPSGNHVWTTSGVYNDTIVNGGVGGCDSIIIVTLTVGNNTNSTAISPIACNSYTSPSGAYAWTVSGTYSDTLSGYAGCDSVITVNLTVNNSSPMTTINPVACVNYVSPNGSTLTTSGTYTQTLTNSQGCDSTITINLTIGKSITTINDTGCDSYTSPSGNHVWTTSETYNDTLTSSLGCDSILTINLTIYSSPDTTIFQTSDTLTAAYAGGGVTYQWVDCDNGNAPVAGATSKTFISPSSGNFALEITENGCTSTSSCYSVIKVSSFEPFENNIQIYPNPSTGTFWIDLEKELSTVSIKIRDVTGRLIASQIFNHQSLIEMELPNNSGIYFVEILSGDMKMIKKMVKK